MSFSDHKITAFTHRIADLPDQPNLPADELKARFDSSPEELRESVNGICDDADRLEARVEGIVVDTFGDTIDKSMLSTELAAELDAKAIETSVASRIAAEQAARIAADTALEQGLGQQISQKCAMYFGTYYGNGQSERLIDLGFQPTAVLLFNDEGSARNVQGSYGGLALQNRPVVNGANYVVRIVAQGFNVFKNSGSETNESGVDFYYLAFK